MKYSLFTIGLLLACLWSALGAQPAATPELASGDRILQQELKQQQLKTTTQRVADQLESIIVEFERNAIEGEDVKVLRAIRSVLGRLGEKEMAQVITWLRQTREHADAGVAARSATDAYAGQRGIILQLNQLVLEYERQQALYELSQRFKEFARRQTANMWMGVGLAKETEGRTLSGFTEAQQSSLRIQQIDQENLGAEIDMLLGKMETLSREFADGPAAERPKAALDQARQGGLIPALKKAAEDLNGGKLLSASGNEKRARDQLREIARLLLLSQGELEAMRQALQELEKAIDQQKAVTADTRQMDKEDTAKVQPRQAEVVDAADLIRRDIENLAPAAAEQLKRATDRMQEARGILAKEKDPQKQREQAPPKQEQAQTHLAQARQALQEQLAKAETLADTPENALEALKQLQAQVGELIKNQEQVKEETATAPKSELPAQAPKQGVLKDTAQQLQQKAATPAPAAAMSLGEAAMQMQQAQSDLAGAQNNPEAQQAALDALQRAGQQLDQEIARLEKARQELAQLEALMQKLAAIVEEQQKVQFSTAKESVKAVTPPLDALVDRQERLGAETGQLRREANPSAPKAAAHLGTAKDRMGEARAELAQSAPKAAQPKQTEALADLYAAQREMERRMNELRELLGLGPTEDAQSMADAAARIEQAQKEVAEALTQMQQSPPGLLDSLLQQQRQIARSLADQNPPAAPETPAGQARKAAEEAARQLAHVNLPKAVASMREAQEAMRQAAPRQQQADAPAQDLPKLEQQQQEVREATESLLSKLASASESALKKAEQSLDNAGSAISPLTSGQKGRVPRPAQAALQAARESLAQSAAQASGGQGVPAQANAASAAEALARAQAALSMAQAGLGSENMMANANQGQGQKQSQGQGQGQGKGQNQGQGQGQGQSGGQSPGQGTPGPQGDGRQGNWSGPGGAEGPRRNPQGAGKFTGLPARDRAAILQSQSEKYPQEYGPLVEQYLKNLSDNAGEK